MDISADQTQIKSKLSGYEKPTPWYFFNRLAMKTESLNLGQGFPDWQPPSFYLEALQKNISDPKANHQYCRSAGSIKLVESISRNYSKVFKREINPLTEVLVSGGACSVAFCALTAFVEAGDEVILLEPTFDCYSPQIQYAGGKIVGVPLIPPKKVDIEKYKKIKEGMPNEDIWTVDFDKLEKSINEKTRILVYNSPNNPTGKVHTYEELKKIAEILKKYPRIIVIADEVYEHMLFEDYEELPRMSNIEGMWDRTISVMSGGKIFSITGARIGWAIGPAHLIRSVHAIHQFNLFGHYEPLQNTIAECLDIANTPYEDCETYYKWLRKIYTERRNQLMEGLAKLKNYKINVWMPEGGYFLMADISNERPEEEKYFLESDETTQQYSKDYNYCLNLANEKKVIAIPCSVFYSKENRHLGENLIRFVFCKKTESLDKALANLEQL